MKMNNLGKNSRLKLKQKKIVSLFLILFLLSLSFAGCVSPGDLSGSFFYQMEGVKFTPQTLMGQSKPALTYWLRKNEEVEVTWSNYFYLIRNEEFNQECDFATEDCVEDFCFPDGEEGPYDIQFIGVLSFLVADVDFMQSDQPKPIIGFQTGEPETIDGVLYRRYFSGCENIETTRPVFQATESGLYRFAQEDDSDRFSIVNHKGQTNGEAKIQVLDKDRNISKTVTFDLRKERIGATDYWRWNMPENDEVWSDNFSKNVRVTRVRILENGNEIKPSRVIYLPNFQGIISGHGQEDANSCYVDASDSDKTINLKECRKNPSANPSINDQITTPVYIQNQPAGLLTWFVEFNTNQGADDATLANDLKIEFTIEATN